VTDIHTPRLRWGIAGYGDVVCARALPAFAELGQDVTGIWGRQPSRAAAVAARYGAGRGFSEFSDLLADTDAVYIATPVASHVPLALTAFAAGRHVLIEKPLSGGLRYDTAALLAAAAGPAVAAVAYYRRMAPALRMTKDLLADRGQIRLWSAFRSVFAPTPTDPKYWRTLVAISGGGVLADAGSHRLDLMCWLLGPPAAVQAVLADPFPGGAERIACLDLAWADGSTARLRCEWVERGLPFDTFGCSGTNFILSLPRLDSGLLLGRDLDTQLRLHLPPERNPLVPVLRDFLDCVGSGLAPECPLADAALVDHLIAAASADSQRQACA
jgi:predicted dehydrogenase